MMPPTLTVEQLLAASRALQGLAALESPPLVRKHLGDAGFALARALRVLAGAERAANPSESTGEVAP